MRALLGGIAGHSHPSPSSQPQASSLVPQEAERRREDQQGALPCLALGPPRCSLGPHYGTPLWEAVPGLLASHTQRSSAPLQGRGIFPLLGHSPAGHLGQGWVRMKPGARSSVLASCVDGRTPSAWTVLCCLSSCTGRELTGSGAAGTRTHALIGMLASQAEA